MEHIINLYKLWSLRRELYYVSLTFLFVLLLPMVGVFVITNNGIEIISDQLVSINLQTRKIELFTPTGELYKTLDINVSWPVTGVVTQEFGEPELPFYLFHTGIDIANPEGKIGDPITPVMPGIVTYSGETSCCLGKHIIIDHGDNLTTVYGHLNALNVKVGQDVGPGKVIGTEGSTGWSTGPHLHFEVRVFGIPVNPRVFL